MSSASVQSLLELRMLFLRQEESKRIKRIKTAIITLRQAGLEPFSCVEFFQKDCSACMEQFQNSPNILKAIGDISVLTIQDLHMHCHISDSLLPMHPDHNMPLLLDVPFADDRNLDPSFATSPSCGNMLAYMDTNIARLVAATDSGALYHAGQSGEASSAVQTSGGCLFQGSNRDAALDSDAFEGVLFGLSGPRYTKFTGSSDLTGHEGHGQTYMDNQTTSPSQEDSKSIPKNFIIQRQNVTTQKTPFWGTQNNAVRDQAMDTQPSHSTERLTRGKPCWKCGIEMKNETQFLYHNRVHNSSSKRSETKQCPFEECKEAFARYRDFSKHLWQNHMHRSK